MTHDSNPAELNLRHEGRGLLLSLYAALRSLKLYPLENTTVQKALDDLLAAGQQLLGTEEEVEIRVSGDFLFVNDVRLRLELDNYASFSQVLGLLRTFEIGTFASCGGWSGGNGRPSSACSSASAPARRGAAGSRS